ncbi:MAG TPA: hypothetical protein VEG61_00545 [Candidatus Dormibacteraeota bacterium]|nr:hypothetical protein [Candidatus Dormibacteraeota bacterium]
MGQVLRNWASLQRSQWLSREELTQIQDSKLRLMLGHAFREVPFYKKLYQAKGVEPGEIRGCADIRRLPVIGRREVASAPLQERTALTTDLNACVPVTTSGSTGTPITILDDFQLVAYLEALYLRFLWSCGLSPLDKTCRVRTRATRALNEGLGLWSKLRSMRHRNLSMADNINDHIKFYLSWKPDLLASFPSYYRILMRFCGQVGRTPTFKRVITEGELLDESTRERINQTFNAEVFDSYGLNEVGGVAWECPTHNGYHINAESLLVEFLRDGEPVSSGEQGQVYVTSLQRMTTPIIRYATGDVATPIDDACQCGRGLPLIKNIQGRLVDFIQTRDGRYLSPFLITRILDQIVGVDQFKVTQKQDYSVELQVKTNGARDEALVRELQQLCTDTLRDTALSIMIVDRIENQTGPKFRLVESQLTQRAS